MRRDAKISDCGLYRYTLWREWDASLKRCAFIMLNPSTADAEKDDPTIRRCIGFAKQWGCGQILVVNLYAFRATKPADLFKAEDPAGPNNFLTLTNRCRWVGGPSVPAECRGPVVAAWGGNAEPGKAADNAHNIRGLGIDLKCLGVNKDGSPKHPLYVPYDTKLESYS